MLALRSNTNPMTTTFRALRRRLAAGLAAAVLLAVAASPTPSAAAPDPEACRSAEERARTRRDACLESCAGRRCALACEQRRTERLERLAERGCPLGEDGAVEPAASAEVIEGIVSMPGGDVRAPLSVVGGDALFEGDIVVGRAEDVASDPRKEGLEGTQSTGRTATSTRWKNAIVPYYVSPSLPNPQRVYNAIRHVEANTNVRFVPWATVWTPEVVSFVPASGVCSSQVGRTGGVQHINLDPGCGEGTVIHEIGHALGLWHEQSRADRDKTVSIQWSNIQPGREFNFQTYQQQRIDGQDLGSFDLGSIMMYGPYSFTRNGLPTITRKNGSIYPVQHAVLSKGDRAGLEAMYPSVPLTVRVHLQDLGDRYYGGNEFAGTRGQSRRLEGFQINVSPAIPGLGVQYMGHIENLGDTSWLPEGTFVGSIGRSLRLEGFAVRLTGPEAKNYTVSYSAHVENKGDTAFVSNGSFCGTRGRGLRIEGITVRISRK